MALWRRSELHSECSGETSVSVRLRRDQSVSTDGMDMSGSGLPSDSYILYKGGGSASGENKLCRLSGAWCEDVRSLDRCCAAETIIRKDSSSSLLFKNRTPDLKSERHRGQNSIDDVVRRLRCIRKQMEDGIEAMHCQMYQIQFCQKSNTLKQHQEEAEIAAAAPVDDDSEAAEIRDSPFYCPRKRCIGKRSPSHKRFAQEKSGTFACVVSSQDAFCATTSRSETTDHSTDYCAEVQKPYSPDTDYSSMFPIHTPVLLESAEMALARLGPDVPEGKIDNKALEGCQLPIPEASAFQNSLSELSLTNESIEDVCRMMEEALFMESSKGQCHPSLPLYPPREFKTDVVFNLRAQFPAETSDRSATFASPTTPAEQTITHCRKKSALDKLFGLFCSGRYSGRRQLKLRNNDRCDRTVTTRRSNRRLWHSRSKLEALKRLRTRPPSSSSTSTSSGCKFTEKYPVECNTGAYASLHQCFSRFYRSDHVLFENDRTVVSSTGTESNYVISEANITSGITCFDVTCHSLDGWCFVGVIVKQDVINDHGRLSRCKTAHGWSNQAECFKAGVPHFIADKEPFKHGTEFQVCVNAEAGTAHFRFPRRHGWSDYESPSPDFIEFEISALPKNVEWSLVLEWNGSARFELNSVSAWQ